ncbi:Dabb [Geosmithia morbida]|uniref:Dabb n=1 Tax=Geosmithia morbida TaxID=1094350 RepID=A0A9P4YUE7_9HYPO|nr:Dabb [Geosmithia morbida]KAF4121214.1 Dabb [Geosmithia morbida]
MINHFVLFKLKAGVTDAQVAEMKALGEAMVGVVPGLKSFAMGPPLAATAARAQGFDLALLAILETEEQLLAYATHPAHVKYGLLSPTLLIIPEEGSRG